MEWMVPMAVEGSTIVIIIAIRAWGSGNPRLPNRACKVDPGAGNQRETNAVAEDEQPHPVEVILPREQRYGGDEAANHSAANMPSRPP